MSTSPEARVAELLGPRGSRFARRGHFAYEGGAHGDTWLALDLLFVDPRRARAAASRLAASLAAHAADVVCGPLVGGALAAQWVAAELDAGFAWAERAPSGYLVPPETRALLRGRAVILVDDVINSGVATRACLREIEGAGGRPVAVGAWIARDAGRLRRELGLPVEVLAELPWQTWAAGECPLCRAGAALDEPEEPANLLTPE
jgi:orotate phosphoribosyltransferase